MYHFSRPGLALSCFLLALFSSKVVAIGSCYAPGPAFPIPKLTAIQSEESLIDLKLDTLVNDILTGKDAPEGWSTKNTSFAIQLTSNKETLWQSYHTAPVLGNYTDSEPTPVTGDTVFRIASCSKVFTVYAVLLEAGIQLDDPITKYLPELAKGDGETMPVKWEEITIRSLASQLSGIGRGTAVYDLAVSPDILPDPLAVGLPLVAFNDSQLSPCMNGPAARACTPSEIIQIAKGHPPIFSPNDRSTYSNIGFSLIGLALENATGKAYSDIIQSCILEPLGMHHTGLTKPKDSVGVIPSGPNDWTVDIGPDNPTGGIYTSANDLSTFLRSILSSILLPQSVTNAWMKPHSWTSSGTSSAYGMPWEILRSTKLTRDGRPIDLITKSGALGGYFSTVAVIPEFGLGVTILVAGDSAALFDLRERLVALVVPAIEDLVRATIKKRYEGFYARVDDWLGPLNRNWSLTLAVDDTGPGLRIRTWTSNGTDFLPVYGKLKGMPEDPTQWSARLLPTNIAWTADEEIWRLTAIPKRKESESGKVFDDYCMTDVDSLAFGGWPVEEFVFGFFGQDEGAGPGAVLMPGMRTELFKDSMWVNAGAGAQAGTGEEGLRIQRRKEGIKWSRGGFKD